MKHMRVPKDLADKLRKSGRLTLPGNRVSIHLQQMVAGTKFMIVPTDGERRLPGFPVKFVKIEGQDLYAAVA